MKTLDSSSTPVPWSKPAPSLLVFRKEGSMCRGVSLTGLVPPEGCPLLRTADDLETDMGFLSGICVPHLPPPGEEPPLVWASPRAATASAVMWDLIQMLSQCPCFHICQMGVNLTTPTAADWGEIKAESWPQGPAPSSQGLWAAPCTQNVCGKMFSLKNTKKSSLIGMGCRKSKETIRAFSDNVGYSSLIPHQGLHSSSLLQIRQCRT